MSKEGRPTGVTILAALEAIVGIYYLATGFSDYIAGHIIRTLARSGIPLGIIPLIPRLLGVALIIMGLASLLLAWGLWTGKGWARLTALVFAILSIIVSLLSFHLLGPIIDIIIIYYLTRLNVKRFFSQ